MHPVFRKGVGAIFVFLERKNDAGNVCGGDGDLRRGLFGRGRLNVRSEARRGPFDIGEWRGIVLERSLINYFVGDPLGLIVSCSWSLSYIHSGFVSASLFQFISGASRRTE